MLAAPRRRGWERRLPPDRKLEGLTLDDVRRIEARARSRAQESAPESNEEACWRAWYNVRVQMLLDGITVCPAGYQWEPHTLTC